MWSRFYLSIKTQSKSISTFYYASIFWKCNGKLTTQHYQSNKKERQYLMEFDKKFSYSLHILIFYGFFIALKRQKTSIYLSKQSPVKIKKHFFIVHQYSESAMENWQRNIINQIKKNSHTFNGIRQGNFIFGTHFDFLWVL